MNTVKVICENCGIEFEKDKGKYNESIKKGWKFFCTKECGHEFRKNGKKVKCHNCGKEIYRNPSEMKKTKNNLFYCSQSCAAQCNGHYFPKRKKIKRIKRCVNCGKDISDSRNVKFCSNKNKCKNEYYYKQYIEKWKNGEEDGAICNGDSISAYIKKYLFEMNDSRCQKCGWGEVNEYSGKVPLEAHHIDGNWKNNRPENLELLCPNCHSLTSTYRNGGKDRMEGRSGKREFYRKNKSSRWVKKEN